MGTAFLNGHYSLAYWQQQDWDYYVVGSLGASRWGQAQVWADDGIVPYWSEINTFILPNRRLRALKANHLEETTHSNSISAIRQAINEIGIGGGNLPPVD